MLDTCHGFMELMEGNPDVAHMFFTDALEAIRVKFLSTFPHVLISTHHCYLALASYKNHFLDESERYLSR